MKLAAGCKNSGGRYTLRVILREETPNGRLRRASELMSLTKDRKQELIGAHKRGQEDTGSAEVQIALLTARITHLTEHFKKHAKDFASRRGLLMMVSRRRRLLDYLKRVAPQRYLDIIRSLGIRK